MTDSLLEIASEVSLHAEAAEVTERSCIPATSAEHIPVSRTEDSRALGLCIGLLQGWQDPPVATLKTQFQEKKYLNKRLSVLQGS